MNKHNHDFSMAFKANNATQELRRYLLSETLLEDSTEYIPLAAVVELLATTTQTIKHRIKEGRLKEKTFFLLEPKRKAWHGVEAGGVKTLLMEKAQRREKIMQQVEWCAQHGQYTTYSQIMQEAGMDWNSPPDRKYVNQILEEINHQSFNETVDSATTCLKGCVVVSVNEGIPTASFYDCAIELGLAEPADLRDMLQKREFWQEQFDLTKELYGHGKQS